MRVFLANCKRGERISIFTVVQLQLLHLGGNRVNPPNRVPNTTGVLPTDQRSVSEWSNVNVFVELHTTAGLAGFVLFQAFRNSGGGRS